MADVNFLRKALGQGFALPDEDSYWANQQAPSAALPPPKNATFGSPPAQPNNWIDNGQGSGGTFDPSNGPPPAGGPLGSYSGDAAGFYQRLMDELTDKRGADWAPADFGQKYGTSWLSGNRERMINEAIPALSRFSRSTPQAYGDMINRFDTRGGSTPWHWLQLLFSASTMMDQDAANDVALYDRTGEAEGDADQARRHALAGFQGSGYNPQITYGDYKDDPRYWIR